MSEIVFILGAGASAQAGAPLMADFIDKADQLYHEGHNFEGARNTDSLTLQASKQGELHKRLGGGDGRWR